MASKFAAARRRQMMRRFRTAGWLLLPAMLLARWAAFRVPDEVEAVYGGVVYPPIARWLGTATAFVPFSVAELLTAGLLLFALTRLWRLLEGAVWRRRHGGPLLITDGLGSLLWRVWATAGLILALFLVLWGLNYARPPLQSRLGLAPIDVETPQVLALGNRLAAAANRSYAALGADPEQPTAMTISFAELNAILDEALDRLSLPGDSLQGPLPPAKRVLASVLLSYAGIGGVYVPFTAEPLVNGGVPDVSLPVAVAHEKAHQRGITDEGEANLVAVLACLAAAEPYVRYSGELDAASRLLGESARSASVDAAEVWRVLDAGPRRDLRAEREFWEQYRGVTTRVAGRINDAYLRGNRVPGGVASYGRVVRLLVALERAGRLPR